MPQSNPKRFQIIKLINIANDIDFEYYSSNNMGKLLGLPCCFALKAFSLLNCKLLMIKPHLTSIDLNRQFLIYTTSQLIVVGSFLVLLARSHLMNDLEKCRRTTFS